MSGGAASLPVNVLTGFLGSGKTTLLRRLLASPGLADTAVLINEFGEVGLDHLLVEALDDTTVLLQSGCICCTIRDDLAKAVRGLHSRRERGLVPRFARLVVETTGLADPLPILSTVMLDSVLRHHFHVGNVVATVDAVNGLANLDEHPETVKQAAVADRLVITKTDITDRGALPALVAALHRINPAAGVLYAVDGELDADLLLGQEAWNQASRAAEVRRWFANAAEGGAHHHAADIRAFSVVLDRPIEWAAFGIWLTMLLNRHGQRLLRVKGVLNVAGSETPVVVHGVQHLVHPPTHLAAWPFGDRRSRLVFIVRGIAEAAIQDSLRRFQSLGASS